MTARRIILLLILFFLAFSASPTFAHEGQPASVDIRQLTPDLYAITYQFPDYMGLDGPPRVNLPSDWKIVGQPTEEKFRDCTLSRRVISVGAGTLEGRTITFPGLENTMAHVLVHVTRSDGTSFTTIATPTQNKIELRGERPWYIAASQFTRVGLEHILTGVDHLLFVLGLLLIVRGWRKLLATITAFTVAHSLTLALATLGYAHAPLNPLNAAIALSILFLGPEIARASRGESSFTIQYPWVIAFAFGLLHGFGFASGLAINGMPRAEIPVALLFFNVGVELGQLFFVAVILALAWSFRTLAIRWPRWALALPMYAVGVLGAYWTIARTVILIAGLS